MISAPEDWEAILDKDERLLWVGSPAQGLRFRPKALFQSFFGLFFFGFALFWTAGAASPLIMVLTGQGKMEGGFSWFFLFFPLFGLPFVIVGFYMVFGHYMYDAYLRKHTRYALTTKRALITAWPRGKRTLKSYPIKADTVVDYEPGDEASIFFANEVHTDSDGDKTTTRIGFEYIPDGASAYAIVRQIQGSAA
jgi:hypothetical protein